MKHKLVLLMTLLLWSACRVMAQGVSHQTLHNDRYVVIVSMDGFRWDYGQMYATPFLDSLGREGVSARMRPSFPSKTFPNHYTIATGLVPDHHGIIANRFNDRRSGLRFDLSDPVTKFDGRFYGGEPIWVTAQRQGVNAGVVYWPGSDTEIQGVRPFVYHNYGRNLLPFDERIREVERILTLPEEERPHLVMCYFSEPDGTGHAQGPYAHKTRRMVEQMDRIMSQFYQMLQRLPFVDKVDLIITSDHGMTATSPERVILLSQYLKPEWVAQTELSTPTTIDGVKLTRNGVTIDYADTILAALQGVPHIRAFRRQEVPAYLQFGTNSNICDVVVIPDLGWSIGQDKYYDTPGAHGYDPYENDMQVPFRAIGPDFRQHYVKESLFQNIAIYPLICHLLGLEPAAVDGRLEDVQDMLRP